MPKDLQVYPGEKVSLKYDRNFTLNWTKGKVCRANVWQKVFFSGFKERFSRTVTHIDSTCFNNCWREKNKHCYIYSGNVKEMGRFIK